MIRGFPNGETRQGKALSPRAECIGSRERTGGSEPSQYPQEKKANAIPSVAASEHGCSPNREGAIAHKRCLTGVVGRCAIRLWSGRGVTNCLSSQMCLERPAIEGESPVGEKHGSSLTAFPSTTGHVKPRGNLGGPSPKAKYSSSTDSEPVP